MIGRPAVLAAAFSLSYAVLVACPATATWVESGIGNTGGPLASDNSGGVIVGARTCTRYDGLGAAQWTSGACLPGGFTAASDAAPDGSGGVLVALVTGDIYAGRVSASGVVLWGSSGVLVCNATGNQSGVVIRDDGSGGAFVVWQDPRNGLDDIYAQRVNAAGVPQWAAN